jgi:hypothetical protein
MAVHTDSPGLGGRRFAQCTAIIPTRLVPESPRHPAPETARSAASYLHSPRPTCSGPVLPFSPVPLGLARVLPGAARSYSVPPGSTSSRPVLLVPRVLLGPARSYSVPPGSTCSRPVLPALAGCHLVPREFYLIPPGLNRSRRFYLLSPGATCSRPVLALARCYLVRGFYLVPPGLTRSAGLYLLARCHLVRRGFCLVPPGLTRYARFYLLSPGLT